MEDDSRAYLLRAARHAIESALDCSDEKGPDDRLVPALRETRGLFVTLKVRGRLRGCIGSVEPRKPLVDLIGDVARAAAFEDPRFAPLRREDLEEMRIEISVLSPPTQIDRPEDIEIGRHGVIVEMDNARGLLLPEVATERQWNVTQFLDRASEKAGLQPGAWKSPRARLFTFTTLHFGEDI